MRLFLIIALIFSCVSVQAQDRESCDADFMAVLEARATLEGQREIEMAQTILAKPDSVLEYTCFARELRRYKAISNRLFSNNNTSNRIFNFPPKNYDPNDLYQPIINSQFAAVPLVESKDGEGIKDVSHPPNPDDNEEKYPGQTHFDFIH